jgi:phenylacetic acid degradation operon negative regulatory protein
MMQGRKTTRTPETPGGGVLSNKAGAPARPLTARSVIASTLLGIDPPRLSALLLARSGELFGISEGTTRVAISRMVAAGELEPDDGGYRLAGHLLDRQARQRVSRAPGHRRWGGEWSMAVVGDRRRSAAERVELRQAMRVLRLAESREGVWLRPDNLGDDHDPGAVGVVEAQCHRFAARPSDESPVELAARLWDLPTWAHEAGALGIAMADLVGPFERGETELLPTGFVLSAAVLRHFQSDPLLPDELVPPGWPGGELRADYERYDRAFKSVWRDWFGSQPGR